MLCALIAGIAMTPTDSFQPRGMNVEYRDGAVVLEGYFVKPRQDVVAPIVLIVHQWGGLGDYEKRRADMLADLGYAAFAVDIYGKGVRPTQPGEKGQQAGKYKNDRALYRSRLIAGLEKARSMPGVDAKRVAIMGYCFGGTGALELARSGADIRGAISFHGGLGGGNPEEAKNIKAKILVLHGADDPNVKPQEIAEFMDEMRAGKVDWHMVSYGNAVHSFTEKEAGNDNSRGAAYNAEADRRSWQELQNFLKEIF